MDMRPLGFMSLVPDVPRTLPICPILVLFTIRPDFVYTIPKNEIVLTWVLTVCS